MPVLCRSTVVTEGVERVRTQHPKHEWKLRLRLHLDHPAVASILIPSTLCLLIQLLLLLAVLVRLFLGRQPFPLPDLLQKKKFLLPRKNTKKK